MYCLYVCVLDDGEQCRPENIPGFDICDEDSDCLKDKKGDGHRCQRLVIILKNLQRFLNYPKGV
jgi:hypothetical protein